MYKFYSKESSQYYFKLINSSELAKCDLYRYGDNNINSTLFNILIIDEDIILYDIIKSITDELSKVSYSGFYFEVLYIPIGRELPDFEEKMEFIISNIQINCIITRNINGINLESGVLSKIIILTFGNWNGYDCEKNIFHFGFSSTSLITLSFSFHEQISVNRFIYIYSNETKGELSEMFFRILVAFKLDEYTIEFVNNKDYDKIDELFQSDIETFVYLDLSLVDDYILFKYLYNQGYNSDKYYLIHFHSNYYIYNEFILKNQYFPLSYSKSYPLDIYNPFITNIMKNEKEDVDILYFIII